MVLASSQRMGSGDGTGGWEARKRLLQPPRPERGGSWSAAGATGMERRRGSPEALSR